MTADRSGGLQRNIAYDDATQFIVQGGDQYVYVFDGEPPPYVIEPFPVDPEALDVEWLLQQPSRLLDARREVVPFAGRNAELDRLNAWLGTARPDAHRLLAHGPGGQGKTRLASQFAKQATAAGWTVRRARQNGDAIEPGRTLNATVGDGKGLLLIVDYADRWTQKELRHLVSHHLRRAPVRILLLGRSVRWFAALRGALEQWHVGADDMLLGPLAETPEARSTVFAQARAVFSDIIGLQDPEQLVPPAGIAGESFSLALSVHMAALVAVYARQRGTVCPVDPKRLAGYLLDREYLNWQRLYETTTAANEFRTPPSIMARSVFAAVLTGPSSEIVGEATLTKLRLDPPSLIMIDHRRCYPPTDSGTNLEPLYPDRLAEDFVALLLPGHEVSSYDPDPWTLAVPERLLGTDGGGAVGDGLRRALVILVEAAHRWEHVAERLLFAMLRRDPGLSLQAGGPTLQRLAELTAPGTVDVLEMIEPLLPEGTNVDLDIAIASVVGRLSERRLATEVDHARRAAIQRDLGIRLANAGLTHEALKATRAALADYRALAGDAMTGHRASFARTLSNLAAGLLRVGEPKQAAESLDEAIRTFHELSVDGSTDVAVRSGLAAALLNSCAAALELGRPQDALPPGQEAVELYRELALRDPGAYEPRVAKALYNLGMVLLDLGRKDEAVPVSEDAVRRYRVLAGARPQRHQFDLARAVGQHANVLSSASGPETALPLAEEAQQLYRDLVEVNPRAFEPNLAGVLTNTSFQLVAAQRTDAALVAADEAVELYERLVAANPAFLRPDLARALANRASVLWMLGRRDAARTSIDRAVAVIRELAAENRDAFEPDLARMLAHRGIMRAPDDGRHESLWAVLRTGASGGRWAAAVTDGEEAVVILRRLTASNPAAFEMDLFVALSNLAQTLWGAGRRPESRTASAEAEALRRNAAGGGSTGDWEGPPDYIRM